MVQKKNVLEKTHLEKSGIANLLCVMMSPFEEQILKMLRVQII